MMYSTLIHEQQYDVPPSVCMSCRVLLEFAVWDTYLCFHEATDSCWGLTNRGDWVRALQLVGINEACSGLIKSPDGGGTGAVEWIVLLPSRVSCGPNGVLVWLRSTKPPLAVSSSAKWFIPQNKFLTVAKRQNTLFSVQLFLNYINGEYKIIVLQ